jgi:hypothetical protein
MNKKLFRNSLLLGFVALLSLTIIDFKPSKPSFEEAIGFFIRENLESGELYTPKEFQQVNEEFLTSLTDVQSSFTKIRDSIYSQLNLLSASNVSTNSTLIKAQKLFEKLSLSTLNLYLITDAHLKRQLKTEGVMDMIHSEEIKMHEGLNNLNSALSTYNLSIFNLNFEASESQIFFHRFELSGGANSPTYHQGIFELDKKTKEVVSYKEI